MQINITFVIQIINFCITYVLLDKIIFRLLIDKFQRNNLRKQSVIQSIKQKESAFTILQKQKNDDLSDFKQSMHDKYQVPQLQKVETPLVINYTYDNDFAEDIMMKGKKLIMEDITNAYKR